MAMADFQGSAVTRRPEEPLRVKPPMPEENVPPIDAVICLRSSDGSPYTSNLALGAISSSLATRSPTLAMWACAASGFAVMATTVTVRSASPRKT